MEKKKILKGFLVDMEKFEAREVDFAPVLEEYYKLLGCELIDIVSRNVGGREFDIICDDEGTFKSPCHVSAISGAYEPMLVGSLLIVHHSEDGATTGLSADDVEHLKGCIVRVGTKNRPQPHPILGNVEY